eukprot:5997659-Prymnesium_polylepis.1
MRCSPGAPARNVVGWSHGWTRSRRDVANLLLPDSYHTRGETRNRRLVVLAQLADGLADAAPLQQLQSARHRRQTAEDGKPARARTMPHGHRTQNAPRQSRSRSHGLCVVVRRGGCELLAQSIHILHAQVEGVWNTEVALLLPAHDTSTVVDRALNHRLAWRSHGGGARRSRGPRCEPQEGGKTERLAAVLPCRAGRAVPPARYWCTSPVTSVYSGPL